MTISADRPLNLDLLGEIFTVIAAESYPPTEERLASDYPSENIAAYLTAFYDTERSVFMEDAASKPPPHPAKREIEELAKKIKDSGGWNLIVNKLGTHKILYGIAVRKAIDNADEITEAVAKVIQTLMESL